MGNRKWLFHRTPAKNGRPGPFHWVYFLGQVPSFLWAFASVGQLWIFGLHITQRGGHLLVWASGGIIWPRYLWGFWKLLCYKVMSRFLQLLWWNYSHKGFYSAMWILLTVKNSCRCNIGELPQIKRSNGHAWLETQWLGVAVLELTEQHFRAQMFIYSLAVQTLTLSRATQSVYKLEWAESSTCLTIPLQALSAC